MKILMLCIEFPPINTTGNYRSASFARHFSKNGIDTVVLTCDIPSGEYTLNKKADYSLMTGLEKVKIHRFPIKKMSKIWTNGIGNSLRIWWNTTDKIDKRWYFGENKLNIDTIIKNEQPDILYISLPPFSMARVAIQLSKKFKLPLVTDMRDAWSLWITSPFSSRFHYYKIKYLEHRLFKKSSIVLGVTPELVKDFIQQHNSVEKSKFYTVFNGYDNFGFSEFEKIKDDNTKYRIGYIGSFYYNPKSEKIMEDKWYKRKWHKKFFYSPRKEQWIYRSPYFLLKSLSLLFENNSELKSKVYFEFIGNKPDWLSEMVKDLELENNFIDHGFKDKKEVINIQASWDAVLATSEKVQNGEHFCLPSKIFDGVVSGKKILAFLTPGSQYNFLKDYAQVTFFNPDETKVNSHKLYHIINSGSNYERNKLSAEFEREYQARKLLNIISDCYNIQ